MRSTIIATPATPASSTPKKSARMMGGSPGEMPRIRPMNAASLTSPKPRASCLKMAAPATAMSRKRRPAHEPKDGEQDRVQDGRAPDLPALETRIEALFPSQVDRTTPDRHAEHGADDGPSQHDEAAFDHPANASRITATGAFRPVQSSKAAAPCAISTVHPSAVRSPRARAAWTSGVPPVEYTRSI